tara:strand:- start:5333 stop:6949 length:1617 start_codon:yes stop_codon:yes gene_type:complete
MDNFNLNKYFKNQYLSEGDISSSDIMPHKLQSHPDIKILIDTLSNFLNLDIEQRLGSGGYNGRSGYYIRMPYELRYWGDESEKAANNAFVKANKLSNEYNFELYDFTDWEEEPGERTWPANIGLFVQEKSLNEDNSYIRVSKPRFIKDKNNPNFLNVYMDYDTGSGGSSIALGKETMSGQIRRESSQEALAQMERIGMKLEDNFNIEDLEIIDLENGKVNLFAVSDDFIEMDPKSELSMALLNEIKLNEIHPKSKELADDYSMGELKDRLSQLYRDMEQEAEPEGGPISDQYADEITFHEDAIRLKKGPIKKDVPYDVAIGKMTQDEYDTVVSKNKFTKSSQFDRMNEGKKIGNNSYKTRTAIVTAPGKTEDKEVIIDNINDLNNVTIRWRGANHHGNRTLTNLKFKQESEGDDDLFAISNDNKWLFIVDRDDDTGEIDWNTLIVDSRELENVADDGTSTYAVPPEDIVNEGEWTLDFGELDEAEKVLKTMNSIKEDKPGLWDNIRAKRASGKSMAKKGSKAYKSAKKAGDKINKEDK